MSGCQYTTTIVDGQHYRCHREIVGGSIYCKTHAIEYEIPQHAAEPISGVFVEDKPKSDYEKMLDHIADRGGLQEPVPRLTFGKLMGSILISDGTNTLTDWKWKK